MPDMSGEWKVTGKTWECEDIKLGHTLSTGKKQGCFSAGNQNDVVRLHIGLKGDYSFTYRQMGRTYDLVGGHVNMMYSKGFDMEVRNKTLSLETFGVQFPRERFIGFARDGGDSLKRFSEDVMEGKTVVFSDPWGAVNPCIEQVIQQVIHCRFERELRQLFLLSKSIELLVLAAEACNLASERKEVFIKSKSDMERIIAVRDLINERVHCPPNLSEIGRIVGLNEYKLKRGFKEVFQTTVFGYLTDQRLNLAHRYLCDTAKTAAEISFELGYATPQHFNNAFKKKFGTTPANVRKNP